MVGLESSDSFLLGERNVFLLSAINFMTHQKDIKSIWLGIIICKLN